MQNPLGSLGLKAACINHEVRLIAQPAMTVVPVSRQAWYVRYNRVAAARQPVEQGGFTDIWSSDQHESGFHGFFGSDGETRSSARGRFLQKLVLSVLKASMRKLSHITCKTAQTHRNSCPWVILLMRLTGLVTIMP